MSFPLTDLIGIVPGAGAAVSAVGAFRFVHEGERGMKLRWGRVLRYRRGPKKGQPKVVMPGFALVIPTVHHLARTHVRQWAITCPAQSIMLKDRTVFNVAALLLFHIGDDAEDVYRALFEINNFEQSIEDFCQGALRDHLAGKGYEAMLETHSLSAELLEMIAPKLREWGVIVISVTLIDCSPDDATTRMIQTIVQADFRVRALTAAAETLDTSPAGLDPTLAAVLVGMPLTAAIGARSMPSPAPAADTDEEDPEPRD